MMKRYRCAGFDFTDIEAIRFVRHHPRLFLFCAGIGLPVLLLAAVFLLTLAVMYPVGLWCGWL